jgi:SSS family solute:Na+ symporter
VEPVGATRDRGLSGKSTENTVQNVNWVGLGNFVMDFVVITSSGFAAVKWRKGDLDLLLESGLGGRCFGAVITWLLLGGDLYTAYAFIAVPALAFGAGADDKHFIL